MITQAQNPFKWLMGQYSTHCWLRVKTVRHEIDECACDTGAILGHQQEVVGAGDGEMGAGDWASLLALSLSLLVASGHKG